MARDYTKYQVKGLGENLNKRQLAFEIVKDYVDKNNPSYDELTSVFKDDVQGNKGFISKLANVKDPKRFNVKMPLKIKFGVEVVVSNQWGSKNIDALLNLAKHLNYTITVENKEVDKKPDEETSSHSSKSNDADLNSYTLIRAYTTENTNEDLQLNKCIVFENHGEFALCFSLSSDGDGVIDSWHFFDTKSNVYGQASSPWGFEEFTDEDEEWTDHESIEDLGYDSNEIALKLDKIRIDFVEKYLNEKSKDDLLNSAAVSSNVRNLFNEDTNSMADEIVVFESGDKSLLPELWTYL